MVIIINHTRSESKIEIQTLKLMNYNYLSFRVASAEEWWKLVKIPPSLL